MTEVDHDARRATLDRRAFMAGSSAMGAGLIWSSITRLTSGDLLGGLLGGGAPPEACTPPPGFPSEIELYKQRFETWGGEIVIDEIWTADPDTPAEAVTLANWAHANGYRIRPRGFMHNWSPLTVTAGTGCDEPVLLVDARTFADVEVLPGPPAAVQVGTGATMGRLLHVLHQHGHSLASVPAVGDITVGGALAIGGHGAAIPAAGETPAPGAGFGTLSNLILELTAVVWDATAGQYAVRTFDRADPECADLLVHLGRAFLLEVVLQVAPAANLRCESLLTIPTSELFAAPAQAGPDSFRALLDRTGRLEVIWFPFTDKPWIKLWSLRPTKPASSRATTGPYNYVFSDVIPNEVNELVDQLLSGPGPFNTFFDELAGLALPATLTGLADRIVAGEGAATPVFGLAQYLAAAAGITALGTQDLWGPAHHTQLYITWETLRYSTMGLGVLTRRDHVQAVVHEFAAEYQRQLAAHRDRGSFPMNGPVEIRVCTADLADQVLVPGAEPPTLSPLRARADHPEWDTVVYLNALTFPGTPGSYELYDHLESWVRSTFTEPDACVRVEWSKGWAYTASGGPWTDVDALAQTIPDDHRAARAPSEDWDSARATFDALDPHRIYANAFLDQLLP